MARLASSGQGRGNQPRVADLLTEIAVQAPELQGSACEVCGATTMPPRTNEREWARSFFISATPQSLRATTTVTPTVTPVGGGLRRFERRIGEAPQIEARKIKGKIAEEKVEKEAPKPKPQTAHDLFTALPAAQREEVFKQLQAELGQAQFKTSKTVGALVPMPGGGLAFNTAKVQTGSLAAWRMR